MERRARGEPGTRHSLGGTWPRTATSAATARHGALSGAGDCFGPLNSPEPGPSETRAPTTELFSLLCSVLPAVLSCPKLALLVSHLQLGFLATLLRPAAPSPGSIQASPSSPANPGVPRSIQRPGKHSDTPRKVNREAQSCQERSP